MNKSMTIKSKTSQSFHRLTAEIRKKFIGDIATIENRDSDLRVVLYSHDTMGIGHMRRNLLIANQIKRTFPKASVLVIAGAKEASTFSQNAGIDCLTLPAFFKKSDGTYTSRNLDIPVIDVLDFRSHTILAAIRSFKPDLFVVDKVPAGAGGELLPTFEWLSENTNCNCVLGLRDILDTPASVALDWAQTHTQDVIRKHFDSIWVYGDPCVYDPTTEYNLARDLVQRTKFTGYLHTESRLENISQLPYQINVPYVLCTVGGGQDGFGLSLSFVEAMRRTGHNSVLLTGPCMPDVERKEIHRHALGVENLKVVEFADEGDLLIKNASHIISMGGYNTITAILSHEKPALVVPRVMPRQEQWIRANRLADLGLVSTIHPNKLVPDSIVSWLDNNKDCKTLSNDSLNMGGLDRIAELIRVQFPSACYKSKPTLNHRGAINGIS